MATINATLTEANLRQAFAAETRASRRYMIFAAQAEAEGHAQAAALFRTIAMRRYLHAQQHMQILEPCPEPAKHSTAYNVRAAILRETHQSSDHYPAMARKAREEGLEDLATWFEIQAKASRSRTRRFQHALDTML